MYNEYDREDFFQEYAKMDRSRLGLEGAGEWKQFRKMLPELSGKRVLDLGCGYGWHCRYAAEQGADRVLGIDLSTKMIEEAKKRNAHVRVAYRVCGLSDYEYPPREWDVVLSNLVLHYVEDLEGVFRKVHDTLRPGGSFLFNIEHPVFTSGVNQEFIYDEKGSPLYWPVDDYFMPGERSTRFLGCDVKKQHHTLTQIFMGMRRSGFVIEEMEEAQPPEEMMDVPGMKDELRRPMMLLVKGSVPL